MANQQCNEWLNEARWLASDATVVFARFAPIADRYAKNPQIAAGLADPNTFSAPHDDIDAAAVQGAMGVLATIFAALTPEQSAALYRFAATNKVQGR